MRTISPTTLTLVMLSLAASTWAQSGGGNTCDLTNDGVVNAADVNAAVNMALGLSPCGTTIAGSGVCNVVIVQRVINAALGGTCPTGSIGNPHSVRLTWVASISANVAGYNVYRASTPVGPFIRLNLALIGANTFTDSAVQSGQGYYYTATSVDTDGNESDFSNPAAQANVP